MASMDGSRSSDEDDTLVISEQEDGEIIFKPQLRRFMQDSAHQDKMEHRRATAAPTSEESTVLKQEEVSHRAEQHRRLDKTVTATAGAATSANTEIGRASCRERV